MLYPDSIGVMVVLLVLAVGSLRVPASENFRSRTSRAFHWTIGIEVTEIRDRLERRDRWKTR